MRRVPCARASRQCSQRLTGASGLWCHALCMLVRGTPLRLQRLLTLLLLFVARILALRLGLFLFILLVTTRRFLCGVLLLGCLLLGCLLLRRVLFLLLGCLL